LTSYLITTDSHSIILNHFSSSLLTYSIKIDQIIYKLFPSYYTLMNQYMISFPHFILSYICNSYLSYFFFTSACSLSNYILYHKSSLITFFLQLYVNGSSLLCQFYHINSMLITLNVLSKINFFYFYISIIITINFYDFQDPIQLLVFLIILFVDHLLN